MGFILSLETSAKVCSVAVHDDTRLLTSAEIHVEQSHASKLAPLIDDLIKFSGLDFSDLNAVAISSGPGSYTGLRIGVSMAKGLCFSLNIPLISVSTLELLAIQMKRNVDKNTLLCPMIDARRMEVYCMVVNTELREVQPVHAKVIDAVAFSDVLEAHKIAFFGDGSPKCKVFINHPNAFFVNNIYPQASKLGVMAFEKLRKNKGEDIRSFEPVYLKEFLIKEQK